MKITFLSLKKYKVSHNGASSSLKICLNEYLGLENGQRLYQAKTDDGCILLIPEDQYEKYNQKKG